MSSPIVKSLFHAILVIENGRYPEKSKFKFVFLRNKLRSSVQVKKKNGDSDRLEQSQFWSMLDNPLMIESANLTGQMLADIIISKWTAKYIDIRKFNIYMDISKHIFLSTKKMD